MALPLSTAVTARKLMNERFVKRRKRRFEIFKLKSMNTDTIVVELRNTKSTIPHII